MSEWKEYKLGEIISLHRGYDLPSSQRKKGTIPIVSSSGISDYHDSYKMLPPGVVTGRYGTIGEVFFLNEPYWPLNTTLYIDDFKGNDPLFIYYFLKSFDFEKFNDKSTIPGINRNHLYREVVKIPSLDEQKRIASILSSLDDMIDLLNRENATLEAMTETLFRQWFIEEAKEDWEEVALGDVVKTTSGGTPSRKHPDYYNNGTIYWVKSKELQSSFIFSTEEMITEDAMNNSSAKLLPEKTVLIAMYGATVGEYGILSKPMTCNQAVCALIPNKNYPYTYLYLWTAFMKQEFINLATGAAQQNISQDLIKQQMVSGDIERIKKYHKHVCAFFDKMECNQKQIMILSKQRDILLPKLMSNYNII